MMGSIGSTAMNLAVTLSMKNQMRAGAASATSHLNQISSAAKKAGHDLDELKEKHRASMMQGGMIIGAGAAAFAPIAGAAIAFAQQEEAGARLKMAMMDAGGSVRKEFDGIQAKAVELGNKLKGSTEDFLRMADTMTRLGVSGETLLNGGLESAAYLGSVLGVPYEQAAEAVAKLREAMGVADGDLLAFMDDIQKLNFQGVNLQEMMYAFTKTSGTMKSLGMNGLQAARDIEPLIGMLIKSGYHGEEAGTSLSMLMTQALDPERIGKANAALAGTGIALEFADKKTGEFMGVQNMIAQLEKLKGLSDTSRMSVLKELTGGGGDSRVASLLIEKGTAGYKAMTAAMKDSADIKQKAAVMDDTLAQKWENLTGTAKNLAAAVGESLKGALGGILTVLNSVVGSVTSFAQAHPGLFRIAAALLAIGGGATMVFGAVRMIGGAFGYTKIMILKAFDPLIKFFATNAYSSTMASLGVTRMAWTWTVLKAKIAQAGVAIKGFLSSATLGWGAMAMLVSAILTDSQGVAMAAANIAPGIKLAITAAAGLIAAINPVLGLTIAIAANWDKIVRAWAIVTGNEEMLAKFGAQDYYSKHYDSQRDQNEREVARKNYERAGRGNYDKAVGETVRKANEIAKGAGSQRTASAEKHYSEQNVQAAQAEVDAAGAKGVKTGGIRDGVAGEVAAGVEAGTRSGKIGRGGIRKGVAEEVAAGVADGTKKRTKLKIDLAELEKLSRFEHYAKGATTPAGMPEDVARVAESLRGESGPAAVTAQGAAGTQTASTAQAHAGAAGGATKPSAAHSGAAVAASGKTAAKQRDTGYTPQQLAQYEKSNRAAKDISIQVKAAMIRSGLDPAKNIPIFDEASVRVFQGQNAEAAVKEILARQKANEKNAPKITAGIVSGVMGMIPSWAKPNPINVAQAMVGAAADSGKKPAATESAAGAMGAAAPMAADPIQAPVEVIHAAAKARPTTPAQEAASGVMRMAASVSGNPMRAAEEIVPAAAKARPEAVPATVAAPSKPMRSDAREPKQERPSRSVTIQNLTINAASGQEGKAVARTVQRELRLAVEMG